MKDIRFKIKKWEIERIMKKVFDNGEVEIIERDIYAPFHKYVYKGLCLYVKDWRHCEIYLYPSMEEIFKEYNEKIVTPFCRYYLEKKDMEEKIRKTRERRKNELKEAKKRLK